MHTIRPIHGRGSAIFRPFVDVYFMNNPIATIEKLNSTKPILAAPETIIPDLELMFEELDELTNNDNKLSKLERSRFAYTEMLANHVNGKVFGEAEKRVLTILTLSKLDLLEYDEEIRNNGADWTYLGMTMAGSKRIRNEKEAHLPPLPVVTTLHVNGIGI